MPIQVDYKISGPERRRSIITLEFEEKSEFEGTYTKSKLLGAGQYGTAYLFISKQGGAPIVVKEVCPPKLQVYLDKSYFIKENQESFIRKLVRDFKEICYKYKEPNGSFYQEAKYNAKYLGLGIPLVLDDKEFDVNYEIKIDSTEKFNYVGSVTFAAVNYPRCLIIMPYSKGLTLSKFPIQSISDFLYIFKQTFEKAAIMHANNNIHNDLNTSNILVNFQKDKPLEIKIIDFGSTLVADTKQNFVALTHLHPPEVTVKNVLAKTNWDTYFLTRLSETLWMRNIMISNSLPPGMTDKFIEMISAGKNTNPDKRLTGLEAGQAVQKLIELYDALPRKAFYEFNQSCGYLVKRAIEYCMLHYEDVRDAYLFASYQKNLANKNDLYFQEMNNLISYRNIWPQYLGAKFIIDNCNLVDLRNLLTNSAKLFAKFYQPNAILAYLHSVDNEFLKNIINNHDKNSIEDAGLDYAEICSILKNYSAVDVDLKNKLCEPAITSYQLATRKLDSLSLEIMHRRDVDLILGSYTKLASYWFYANEFEQCVKISNLVVDALSFVDLESNQENETLNIMPEREFFTDLNAVFKEFIDSLKRISNFYQDKCYLIEAAQCTAYLIKVLREMPEDYKTETKYIYTTIRYYDKLLKMILRMDLSDSETAKKVLTLTKPFNYLLLICNNKQKYYIELLTLTLNFYLKINTELDLEDITYLFKACQLLVKQYFANQDFDKINDLIENVVEATEILEKTNIHVLRKIIDFYLETINIFNTVEIKDLNDNSISTLLFCHKVVSNYYFNNNNLIELTKIAYKFADLFNKLPQYFRNVSDILDTYYYLAALNLQNAEYEQALYLSQKVIATFEAFQQEEPLDKNYLENAYRIAISTMLPPSEINHFNLRKDGTLKIAYEKIIKSKRPVNNSNEPKKELSNKQNGCFPFWNSSKCKPKSNQVVPLSNSQSEMKSYPK